MTAVSMRRSAFSVFLHVPFFVQLGRVWEASSWLLATDEMSRNASSCAEGERSRSPSGHSNHFCVFPQASLVLMASAGVLQQQQQVQQQQPSFAYRGTVAAQVDCTSNSRISAFFCFFATTILRVRPRQASVFRQAWRHQLQHPQLHRPDENLVSAIALYNSLWPELRSLQCRKLVVLRHVGTATLTGKRRKV